MQGFVDGVSRFNQWVDEWCVDHPMGIGAIVGVVWFVFTGFIFPSGDWLIWPLVTAVVIGVLYGRSYHHGYQRDAALRRIARRSGPPPVEG